MKMPCEHDHQEDCEKVLGDTVYHVANPLVPGRIVGFERAVPMDGAAAPQIAYVLFQQPVGFSGNPRAGLREDWLCDPALLYRTPEEALQHNKKDLAE